MVVQFKHLPTTYCSALWCWQYRTRRAVARMVNMLIYRMRKRLNRPRLRYVKPIYQH